MLDLTETHSVGPRTREWMVGRDAYAALGVHRIFLAGHSEAVDGFAFVRLKPRMSQILACHGGSGEVLIDGAWRACEPGMAYLTPPGVPHAYHARPRGRFDICWVLYDESSGEAPMIAAPAPVLAALDPRPLLSAVQGLYQEFVGPAEPAVMHHWIELIQCQVQRAVQPWRKDERLWALWEAVDADLARSWTVGDLARQVHISGEHLRRLCHQFLGRSPSQQVAFLRMRRAATLLASTPRKVETIAGSVGYDNPFAFSTAFKRWMGVSPAGYREKR